jgi:hypothetical protein
MEINVADHVGPAFDAVFQDIIHHRHTHYWMKGGRGSTKSSFVSVVLPPSFTLWKIYLFPALTFSITRSFFTIRYPVAAMI